MTEFDFEQLSAYLDGELTETERVGLEQRLASDASLRAELDTLRQLVSAINALPELTAPRDFIVTQHMLNPQLVQMAADALPDKTAQTPAKVIPMRRNPTWISVAAALVVVVLGGALLLTQLNSGTTPTTNSVALVASSTPTVLENDGIVENQAAPMVADSANVTPTAPTDEEANTQVARSIPTEATDPLTIELANNDGVQNSELVGGSGVTALSADDITLNTMQTDTLLLQASPSAGEAFSSMSALPEAITSEQPNLAFAASPPTTTDNATSAGGIALESGFAAKSSPVPYTVSLPIAVWTLVYVLWTLLTR